jgi:hypothetical protein
MRKISIRVGPRMNQLTVKREGPRLLKRVGICQVLLCPVVSTMARGQCFTSATL